MMLKIPSIKCYAIPIQSNLQFNVIPILKPKRSCL